MIYLRFESSKIMVNYVKIQKPRFQEELETELSKYYNLRIASRYASIIDKFIYENMNFPTDGIYYVNSQTNTFWLYSEQDNCWYDTKMAPNNYIIKSEDAIWKQFFSQNIYLEQLSKTITSIVMRKTESLFHMNKWKNISSIDIETGKICEDNVNIPFILDEFFSEKVVHELYSEIRKKLFATQDDKFVLIKRGGCTKDIITESNVIKLSEERFHEVKNILSCYLKENDLDKFMNTLKNKVIYNNFNSFYEITYKDINNNVFTKYNGNKVLIDKSKLYIKASDELFNAIKNALKNSKEYKEFFNDVNKVFDKKGRCIDRYHVCKVKDFKLFISEFNITVSIHADLFDEYSLYDGCSKTYYYARFFTEGNSCFGVNIAKIDMHSKKDVIAKFDSEVKWIRVYRD